MRADNPHIAVEGAATNSSAQQVEGQAHCDSCDPQRCKRRQLVCIIPTVVGCLRGSIAADRRRVAAVNQYLRVLICCMGGTRHENCAQDEVIVRRLPEQWHLPPAKRRAILPHLKILYSTQCSSYLAACRLLLSPSSTNATSTKHRVQVQHVELSISALAGSHQLRNIRRRGDSRFMIPVVFGSAKGGRADSSSFTNVTASAQPVSAACTK